MVDRSTFGSRSAAALATLLGIAMLLVAVDEARSAAEDRPLRASAQLEPGVAGPDELVTFSITLEAGGFGGVQAAPTFELENLDIVAGPYQSRSQRWVNGETSSSVQLSWRLRARAIGPAAVTQIRIRHGESILDLADRRMEIVAQAPPGRGPAPGTRRSDPFEDLFSRAFPDGRSNRRAPAQAPKIRLQAEIAPAEPYVGQQATYTLWLYTQSDISAFQPTEIPDFRGFWVREVPQPQELKPEWVEIGGERFGRVPMLRRALYPLQEGRFTIQPTEADVVARIAEIGPFGSPFGRNESLHLKTESVTVTARPLPTPESGAGSANSSTATAGGVPVGEIVLSAKLDRNALEVGQAATLTVRCTGRGNLQSLAPPALDLPEGLKSFPPKQDSSERANDGVLVSSTEWTYVLVPDRPGRFEVGAIAIPFFDPKDRQYRVASAEPQSLAVTGNAAAQAERPDAEAGGEGADESPQTSPDASSETASGWAWTSSRRLWAGGAAAAIGVGLLVLVPLARRRSRAPASGSARALQAAIAGASTAPTPRLAAAELEEAWRQHLALRWEIPPGTPVSGWSERLIAAKADSGAAQELENLAHELHYLRYAPELSAADRLLADALSSSRRLARVLR